MKMPKCLYDNLKNKKVIISLILIIILLLMSFIIFLVEPVRESIISILKKEEVAKSIEYEVYSNENNIIKMLLKFKDSENGISEIQLPDGDKLKVDGRNEIGIDYVIEKDGEYTFVSKSTTGEEIRETINVNEEYRNNLIGIEKIQEISTEQDYSITKKYDGESNYTYYYAIGENNTEWVQIPQYLIVNVDSYKVDELNWKNEDGTVTLKVKKVGASGNTVEVKKKITDLNTAGIEFKEERVLEGESLIACIKDNELESGNYRLKVNGEEYPAEIYNYEDENVNYITDKNLGTREADSRMLIMKYKGNLTVNQERIVTAETRKKGMFIYVEEGLTNSGEISMTEKGAEAEGQDVYLLKTSGNSYEYVPAEGATGASGVYHSVYGPSKETAKNGEKGADGENRATGGGGSGRVYLVASSSYSFRLSATSGAGTSGTSYSGGKGGGPAYKSGSGNNEYGSNGTKGANGGAGGLLILHVNSFNNTGSIVSRGKNSTLAGATGGGSINIFYNELISQGTIEAIGGIIEETDVDKGIGGKGGNGTVTLNNLNELPKGPVISDNSGANSPNLDKIAQKTYVTWELNGAGTEYVINDEQTTQPDNWYDYENGKWANIKTTNSGLEAYWVWIPRYEYIVPTSTTATEIEAKFIPVSKTEADEGYTIHPAFTNEGNGGFGELDGIWVAKFEAVSNNPTASEGGGNNSSLKVQVIPSQPSWRYIETKNMFSVCRKMTNTGEVLEGSTVDSHMMKNTEWGAVAILSQSKYGVYNPESINGEKGNKEYQIWNNSSSSYITGAVGTSKDASNTEESSYNSANGPKASTTGTVYGVYDMAGGSWEYVAGCLNGKENAKFGVTAGDSKYVDLYTNSSNSYSSYDGAKIGDATKETKGWNSDYARFVYSSGLVFGRGRCLQH
ncbi:MAG: hypothetical protein HFJ59_04530 [Clostridia bacterium]|nr:hypothetical protein [Clostridia bacterium]